MKKATDTVINDLVYNIYNKDYANAYKVLQVAIDEKIKDRIKSVTHK